MEYFGAGGKLIHEKNQKQKISWHCPFDRLTVSPTYRTIHKKGISGRFWGKFVSQLTLGILILNENPCTQSVNGLKLLLNLKEPLDIVLCDRYWRLRSVVIKIVGQPTRFWKLGFIQNSKGQLTG